MSLRNFAILCILRFAKGVRPEDGNQQGAIANEGRRGCDLDKMPDEMDKHYCAGFQNDQDACRAQSKCKTVDMLTASGALECLPTCKNETPDDTAAAIDFAGVPQGVKDAVEAARALVQKKTSAAAAKLQQKKQADDEAKKAKATFEAAQKQAEEELIQAEKAEAEAQMATNTKNAAIQEAEKSDTEWSTKTRAYEAAVAAKKQKLDVKNQQLKAKQQQEVAWKVEKKSWKDEIEDIFKKQIPGLQQRLAELEALKTATLEKLAKAKARGAELQTKRTENEDALRAKIKNLKGAYMQHEKAYIEAKKDVDELAKENKAAADASQQATESKTAAIKEYWIKKDLLNQASEKKSTAQEKLSKAQVENDGAHFALTVSAGGVTLAEKEQQDYEKLKIKVEKVYEYADIFYNKLGEVQQPNGNNPMMKVLAMANDAALKPCLLSYNVIITAANDLAKEDQPDILGKLKTGLTQIDKDRYEHFRMWICTDKEDAEKAQYPDCIDFVPWIWSGNGIEKVELAIP